MFPIRRESLDYRVFSFLLEQWLVRGSSILLLFFFRPRHLFALIKSPKQQISPRCEKIGLNWASGWRIHNQVKPFKRIFFFFAGQVHPSSAENEMGMNLKRERKEILKTSKKEKGARPSLLISSRPKKICELI